MDYRLKDKTVCIAGLGYAGLPLALAFSEHPGARGFGVDAGGPDRGLKRRTLMHRQLMR